MGSRKRSIPHNRAVKLQKGKGFSHTRLTFDHPDKHYRNTSENAVAKHLNNLPKKSSVVNLNKKQPDAESDINIQLFATIEKPKSASDSDADSKFQAKRSEQSQPQIKVLDEQERIEFLNMQTKLVEIIDKDRDRIQQLEKKLEELQNFKDKATIRAVMTTQEM